MLTLLTSFCDTHYMSLLDDLFVTRFKHVIIVLVMVHKMTFKEKQHMQNVMQCDMLKMLFSVYFEVQVNIIYLSHTNILTGKMTFILTNARS